MKIPYPNRKKQIAPLILGINPTLCPEDVYDIVIGYASKASEEYSPNEMWLDATSPFMRAKINVEAMMKELNEPLGIVLSQKEILQCAGALLSFTEYIAVRYIGEHSFLQQVLGSQREFPQTDVHYAMVILAFEVYLCAVHSLVVAGKERNYQNIRDQLRTYESEREVDRMRIELDRIVMHHRKYLLEHPQKASTQKYRGEYTLQVEDGSVTFPWDHSRNRVWILSESRYKNEKSQSCLILDSADVGNYLLEQESCEEKVTIRDIGTVVVESDGTWKIPEAVAKYINSEEIVFFGMDSYVEVMSVKDMQNYQNLLTQLEEEIQKLVKEKGWYDECKK